MAREQARSASDGAVAQADRLRQSHAHAGMGRFAPRRNHLDLRAYLLISVQHKVGAKATGERCAGQGDEIENQAQGEPSRRGVGPGVKAQRGRDVSVCVCAVAKAGGQCLRVCAAVLPMPSCATKCKRRPSVRSSGLVISITTSATQPERSTSLALVRRPHGCGPVWVGNGSEIQPRLRSSIMTSGICGSHDAQACLAARSRSGSVGRYSVRVASLTLARTTVFSNIHDGQIPVEAGSVVIGLWSQLRRYG